MDRDDIFQDDPSNRSPLALEQGTLLNDQFRVGRVLGVGGFGVTYLAFDEVLEMVVAIKEYLPNDIAVRETDGDTIHPLSSAGGTQDFEYGLERFLQEARTLAKFERHSNIVRVRTFFEENGTAYLVMNFYEGRTLAEYLEDRNGFIPEEEALLILEQVVDGLAAVHGEEILHRDIDPNNVYLADDGTVVLLDFGAARTAVGERTQSMSVVLKRGYAPHEQYHSHGDQGPWTDVYACAATLYRAVTGYKPPEAAARILDDDLAEPSELVPSLSEATNEAIVEGLEIRPDDRPESIESFAELLPDPPPDAEPGWIGETTSLERGADLEGTAELQVTATHACRLYVDGQQTATLPPAKSFTIGVEDGTHRLRAVRTDRTSSGQVTVTASGTNVEEGTGETRLSLDALVWQDVVSVSSGEPTVVEIDFEADAAGAPETTVTEGGGDSLSGETMKGETVTPGEGRTDGTAETAETVRPGGGAEPTEEGAVAAEGDAPPESPPRSERAPEEVPGAVQVEVDRPAHLFVDGEQIVLLDSEEQHSLDLSPGTHRLRAEAADGPERWEQDVGVVKGKSQSVQIALDRSETHDRGTVVSEASLQYVALGVGGLVLLLMFGWWGLSNERPRPRPDRLYTTADAALVDVVANDRDPDGSTLRVQSVASVPDSVGRVTVVDSARLRFRPASTFAGTARVSYVLADAAGDTAHARVTLQVPFNGTQQVVTSDLDQPQVVHADSLGDDGDLDVVIASLGDRAVSWSQNALADQGEFQAPRALDSAVDGAVDVHTADLSGNGRVDVLSASLRNDVVAWYENRGGGEFSAPRPLTTTADGAVSVRTADLDRDGDPDVVSGALLDQTVRWYENAGDGTFSEGRLVTANVRGLETLHVTDLDQDQVPDILVVSYQDSTISRYEPTRQADSLRFVERPPIGTDLREPIEVHTADVTGNGRKDVIAGKAGEESIVLFENRADPTQDELTFDDGRVLVSDLRTVEAIDSGDLDGDGDLDIFAASFDSDKIVWFENESNGTFGTPQPIATRVPDVLSLEVADVDRDGHLDVLTASQAENAVLWFENRL
jgi:serine/threonine protein kinase